MPYPIAVDVLPVQVAVAAASPRSWRDGIVARRTPGELTLALLDGTGLTLLSSADAAVGEPVAVHPVAHVLAVGGTWYGSRPVDPP